MQCKFLEHGISINYDHVIRPCCDWRYNADYAAKNHISQIDPAVWLQSLATDRDILNTGQWPKNCNLCQIKETAGDSFSLRLNGIQAYSHYQSGDITLEIRPGSVCNFACQTCWPAASSRVMNYYQQVGLLDTQPVAGSLHNFEFLSPVRDRIRDVVLLGGEPFYDPSCRTFLDWASQNLTAKITMFTNGSHVDWDFVANYPGQLNLVFSLDAVGAQAEYIRYGTVWSDVLSNFTRARSELEDITVNVTTSIYNYLYLPPLVELLVQPWPSTVTWGVATTPMFTMAAIQARDPIARSLERCLDLIDKADIPRDQKSHAHNALAALRIQVDSVPYQESLADQLRDFVIKMDQVKHCRLADHCAELAKLIKLH
jgi:hypothetical protein